MRASLGAARTVSYAAPCTKPRFIPTPKRLVGTKRLGVQFEKQLARAVPKALHGQWFEYRDGSGPGWCQMDLLLVGAKQVVVIEAKLANWEEAQAQLSNLYLPVLSSAYPEKKVKGVIALRHLSRVPRETPIHERLSSAMLSPEPFPIFHWLGKGPVD